MLGTIDGAVLSACATEGKHQVGEASLKIALYMGIGQAIDAVEEREYLAIVLEEADDGLVEAGELLVGLVATRVVGGAAVEYVAASVATFVLRNALAE